MKSFFLCLLFVFTSCNEVTIEGIWKFNLALQDDKLPFIVEIIKNKNDRFSAVIHNSDEKIPVKRVMFEQKRLTINLPVFDSVIKANLENGKLNGYWEKLNRKKEYKVSLDATKVGMPTRLKKYSNVNLNPELIGEWELTFADGKKALGIFTNHKNVLKGSIITPTGDFRYLEGFSKNNEFKLYGFDGGYAFIYSGVLKDGVLRAELKGGKDWNTRITGKKNNQFKIDKEKQEIELISNRFDIDFVTKNKTSKDHGLVIQILGTWCPNCIDETMFLSQWQKRNPLIKVDILGIAFEKSPSLSHAKMLVRKLRTRTGAKYPISVGSFDKDKQKVTDVLTMIKSIPAYPTTLFIDSKGLIKHVHSGFSGPATGIYYEQYKKKFNSYIQSIID